MKLGSLFDGSGTCPLAASMLGIEPAWASEIEPYPVAITTARFPNMKHLGDITKIDGGAIEPVDIITFGSPCQDLSVAGKQKGLIEGERSNLFFEAVRIIKEMREATNGRNPRYIVWENVPGAFSSNQGRDFLEVIRQIAKIPGGDTCTVPEPESKNGKLPWGHAGCIVGNDNRWSLAWRIFDSQFWGVPQRRKRIYLVADFAGCGAGKILFESESLLGDFESSRKAWEEASGHAVGSTDRSCGERARERENITFVERAGCEGGGKGILCGSDKVHCLNTVANDSVCVETGTFQNTGVGWWNESSIAATLRTPSGSDSINANVVVLNDQGGSSISTDTVASTLRAESHQHEPVIAFEPGIAKREGRDSRFQEDITPTLRANAGDNQVACAYGFCPEESAKTRGDGCKAEQSPTLRAGTVPGVSYTQAEVTHGGCWAMTTGNWMDIVDEASPTLMARDYKDPPIIITGDNEDE